MPDFAPGLPDPKRFGDPTKVDVGQILPWVVQEHRARRAGKHHDVRFGLGKLHSFATKKDIPGPGGKINLYQQPLHREEYKNFEGELPAGYGQGSVKPIDKGEIVIQSTGPGKIVFSTGHKAMPERFALIRSKANPKTWLLANITPTDKPEHAKLKYETLPADQVETVLSPENILQPKVDGASMFFNLIRDKLEAVSYRTSKKTGGPIVHTERMGLGAHRVPKALSGTVLAGEAYGERRGRAIPPQELGGLLNASLAESLRRQSQRGIKMRAMPFAVRRFKGKDIPPETPYPEQQKMLEEVMPHLPPAFHLPPTWTPEEAGRMLGEMQKGKYPLTSEGLIAHPVAGGRPTKVKITPESDVHVRGVFPGEGKYEGVGAGGFEYSLEPEGPIVGKVGTGLSDELRRELLADPEAFIGRVAKIRSQGQFPGGAHRAPSLLALHEDPVKTAAYTSQMALAKLKKKYPHLAADPVHMWRSEHDVELIHREPDLKELRRIWKNWQQMTTEQKALSDAKAQELFGVANEEHYNQLLGQYTKASAETVKLPDVRQHTKNDCGSTALLAILGAEGKDTRGNILDKKTQTTTAGTGPENIIRAAASYGVKALKMHLTVPMLKLLLSLHMPVIVDVQAWPDRPRSDFSKDKDDGHYMVATGFDKGRVVFEDPATFGRVYLDDAQLLNRWHDEGDSNVGIVILNHHKADPTPKNLQVKEYEERPRDHRT